MSNKIDEEKVLKVSMDTDEFQKYAKETIDTLSRFENQMESMAKNVNLLDIGTNMVKGFKQVEATIDQVGKKYGWLEQIAVGAYRKIGESVTNYMKNEVLKITGISEAISGWQKYESEVESVQSIMNATGLDINAVEKELKKLGWYTDETSFKYADMVSNIAKFNAAGISDLGEATDSMIGIGNMAGYFGVNATKATHAMEGFAKAMGVGFMGSDSWKWIETAGMNAMAIQKAFIDTAVEMKQIKKVGKDLFETKKGHQFTSSEFKTVLKDKWLDKAVMTETFKKYSKSVNTIYDAWLAGGEIDQVSDLIEELGDSLDKTSRDAFRASQQAKTFTDVVGSLEEVVASGWRTSFKYIFGNYEEARKLWTGVVNELWDIFADSGYKRNDLLKGWYEGGGRDAFLQGVANMWYGLMAIINPIKEAFDEIFPGTTIERLIELSKKFEEFTGKFRGLFDYDFIKKRYEVTDSIDEMKETTESFEDACKRTRKEVRKLANEIIAGKWGNGIERFKALGEAGYVWQVAQNEVNKILNETTGSTWQMHEIVDDGTLKKSKKLVEVTKEEEKEITAVTKESVEAMNRANRLFNTAKGIASVIAIIRDVLGQVGKFFGKLVTSTVSKLGPTFDKILEKTSKWGKSISEVYDKWKENDTIAKTFDNLGEILSDAFSGAINWAIPALIDGLSTAVDWIKKISDFLYPILEVVVGGIYFGVTNLPGALKKVWGAIKPTYESLKTMVGPYLTEASNWIKNTAYPFVKSLPQTVGPFLVNTYNKGKKFVTDVWNNIVGSQGYQKFKSTIKNMWESVKTFGKNIWNYIKELADDASSVIGQFFKNYTTEEGGFDWAKLFADTLDFAMGKVSDFIAYLGDLIGKSKDFFKMFNKGGEAEGVQILAANIGSTTQDLDKFADEKLAPAAKLLENIFNWLKDTTEFLKDPISYAASALKGVVDYIISIFDGLNLEKLASIFKDTGVGLFFGALAKNMLTGATSIASIPSAFAGTLWALKDVFTAYSKSINAKAILNIAKALGIMTISIIALASIPIQTLTDIAGVISVLGLVMSLIVGMMALYQKHKKVIQEADTVKSFYQIEMKGSDMVTALVTPLREFMATMAININTMLKKIAGALRIVALAAGIAIIAQKIMDIYNFITQVNAEGEDGKRKLYESIGFIVAIGTALVAIQWLLGKQENKNSIGWAISFVTIAIGLGVIIEVVKQIARWDTNTINNAWAAVTMATVALIGIAYALHLTQTELTKNKDGWKSQTKNAFLGIAVILIALSAALVLMTPSLIALGSTLSLGSMIMIMIVMAAFAGVVIVLGYVAKEIGKQAKNIALGTGAMTLLIAMVTMMFAVFTLIGAMMLNNGIITSFVVGLVAIGLAMGAVAVFAKIMDKVGATPAISKFAEAMSKFGFGVIAFSIACALFAKAAPTIIDAIIYLGEQLNDSKKREALIHGILAIGLAILAAILLMKTDLASTILEILKTIFGTLFSALKQNLGTVLTTITDFITKIANWLDKHKVVLFAVIGLLILSLFSFLDAILPSLVDRLARIVLILINSLAKTLLVRAPQLLEALLNVLKVILALLSEAIAGIFGGIVKAFAGEKAGQKVSDIILDFLVGPDGVNELEKGIDNSISDLQKQTDKYEENAVKTINDTKTNIKNKTSGGIDLSNSLNFNNLNGGTNNFANQKIPAVNPGVNNLISGGQETISSLIGGDKSNIYSGATEAFSGLTQASQEQFDLTKLNTEDGMIDINQIISSYGGDTSTEVEQTANEIDQTTEEHERKRIEIIDTHENEIYDLTTGTWRKLEKEEDGYHATRREKQRQRNAEEKAESEQAAWETLVDPVLSALDEVVNVAPKKAAEMIAGYCNEFYKPEHKAAIWAAGSGVAKQFLTAYDVTTETSSPSRQMMWRALMAINGLVKGTNDNLYLVTATGVNLATTLLTSCANALDNAGDLTPTITPVVGISGITSGLGTIDTMFNRSTMSTLLASDAFKGFNQNQILKQEATEVLNANNAGVITQLEGLRTDVTALNDSMLNTQVVLDSGALVGATAKQMDNALGRFKTLKGRGI